jgi:hypothetical protein
VRDDDAEDYEPYAPGFVVGGQRDAGLYVDGWDFSGRGLDWCDRANQSGWCRRDTDKYLATLYVHAARMNELFMRPSPIMARLTRP